MAKLFYKHGAKVVIVDIRDELGQALCDEIGDESSASYLHCDVTKEIDVENAINFTIAKYGKLDIMVNNAAIAGEAKTSILDNDVAEFEQVVGVNLTGPFIGTKHAARVMIPNKKGTELGRTGIRVNCLSPYFIADVAAKELFKLDDEGCCKVYSNLKGVVLQEEDVAEAAVYLASDESNEAKTIILDNDVAEFEQVVGVNLTGPFIGTKHAARVTIPNKKGSIIIVGSVCSSAGGIAPHAYTSSKHGLIGLTKNVAAKVGRFGIRVNCLSPYFIANVAAKELFKLDDEGCSKVYSNLKGVVLQEDELKQLFIGLVINPSMSVGII
ncbi:secoisolariciresinol dehydrogenase-like [Quillaja saponaria]|uniref:Secoisolariciresinol dehydrogenase-like n=1 Tax=Quillaja saponaria TaxID=32244 RepID=A0AAD7VH64_QUISA|nr:secoisolariciresinol dehydrogenase-like [Quillaja saponaria]